MSERAGEGDRRVELVCAARRVMRALEGAIGGSWLDAPTPDVRLGLSPRAAAILEFDPFDVVRVEDVRRAREGLGGHARRRRVIGGARGDRIASEAARTRDGLKAEAFRAAAPSDLSDKDDVEDSAREAEHGSRRKRSDASGVGERAEAWVDGGAPFVESLEQTSHLVERLLAEAARESDEDSARATTPTGADSRQADEAARARGSFDHALSEASGVALLAALVHEASRHGAHGSRGRTTTGGRGAHHAAIGASERAAEDDESGAGHASSRDRVRVPVSRLFPRRGLLRDAGNGFGEPAIQTGVAPVASTCFTTRPETEPTWAQPRALSGDSDMVDELAEALLEQARRQGVDLI